MAQRDVVFPSGRQALYERNRYSPAIRSNGFLFVSGQVGREGPARQALWAGNRTSFMAKAPAPTRLGLAWPRRQAGPR